ncbi:sulfoxide reductase heme-binding subunit YedZ [Acuticoccus sp. M5D2P5]|uniref:sulfite oxidase heme-binding subunit YedZ n=1 Tax=Acuticoccus kalidii TaxID=2910977 RepID=UPI001F480E30|nr:protein-methionine-sulfoxide reductase heme-binding subunit MsrQ [Acuticoccus kalidii]MCF3936260.1 sulfoxide reductase heme-binding subunit YedZ [Acuticoccus kalidii]
MELSDILPWNDRRGRFSWLRMVAFLAAVLPSLFIVWALYTRHFAAEPFKEATHLSGTWTLYFLLASLAVTPLRRLVGWSRLVGIRRLLGLTAFAYVFGHFMLYVIDQDGDIAMVASEIALRIYLTIGFVALVGFAALAATSFDAAIRRMGQNWRTLHKFVYLFTALGLLHFFMQTKVDVTQPVLLTGVFIGLMLYRALDGVRARFGAVAAIVLVSVLAGLGASVVEFLWYGIASGAPPGRVFLSNFDFSYQIRPMWYAMLITAAPLPVVLVKEIARRIRPAPPPRHAKA